MSRTRPCSSAQGSRKQCRSIRLSKKGGAFRRQHKQHMSKRQWQNNTRKMKICKQTRMQKRIQQRKQRRRFSRSKQLRGTIGIPTRRGGMHIEPKNNDGASIVDLDPLRNIKQNEHTPAYVISVVTPSGETLKLNRVNKELCILDIKKALEKISPNIKESQMLYHIHDKREHGENFDFELNDSDTLREVYSYGMSQEDEGAKGGDDGSEDQILQLAVCYKVTDAAYFLKQHHTQNHRYAVKLVPDIQPVGDRVPQTTKPRRIAIVPNYPHLVVVTYNSNIVCVYDTNICKLSTYCLTRSHQGDHTPYGVVVTNDNFVIVADKNDTYLLRMKLTVSEEEGGVTAELVFNNLIHTSSANEEPPYCMALRSVGDEQRLLVLHKKTKMSEWTSDGTLIRNIDIDKYIGSTLVEDVTVIVPTDQFALVEKDNHCVSIFDGKDGIYLRSIGLSNRIANIKVNYLSSVGFSNRTTLIEQIKIRCQENSQEKNDTARFEVLETTVLGDMRTKNMPVRIAILEAAIGRSILSCVPVSSRIDLVERCIGSRQDGDETARLQNLEAMILDNEQKRPMPLRVAVLEAALGIQPNLTNRDRNADGIFFNPCGITTDAYNHLLVLDTTKRVQVFNSESTEHIYTCNNLTDLSQGMKGIEWFNDKLLIALPSSSANTVLLYESGDRKLKVTSCTINRDHAQVHMESRTTDGIIVLRVKILDVNEVVSFLDNGLLFINTHHDVTIKTPSVEIEGKLKTTVQTALREIYNGVVETVKTDDDMQQRLKTIGFIDFNQFDSKQFTNSELECRLQWRSYEEDGHNSDPNFKEWEEPRFTELDESKIQLVYH